jgi:hypothetical protein
MCNTVDFRTRRADHGQQLAVADVEIGLSPS